MSLSARARTSCTATASWSTPRPATHTSNPASGRRSQKPGPRAHSAGQKRERRVVELHVDRARHAELRPGGQAAPTRNRVESRPRRRTFATRFEPSLTRLAGVVDIFSYFRRAAEGRHAASARRRMTTRIDLASHRRRHQRHLPRYRERAGRARSASRGGPARRSRSACAVTAPDQSGSPSQASPPSSGRASAATAPPAATRPRRRSDGNGASPATAKACFRCTASRRASSAARSSRA